MPNALINLRRRISCTLWKIRRQKFSKHETAHGLALGVLISFLLPFGQIILVLLIKNIWHFNYRVTLISLWVTNPWTIPFLYPAFVSTGSIFSGNPPIDISKVNKFSELINQYGSELAIDFFIGATTWAIIGYLFTYFFTLKSLYKKSSDISAGA